MEFYTLDSNILIYHLQGEKTIRDLLEQWLDQRRRLFISAITRIELLAASSSAFAAINQDELLALDSFGIARQAAG